MIQLERLPCPEILQEKGAAWTERFLERRAENHKLRPPKKQYGHQQILDALSSMSHRKCFYCEHRMEEDEYTVDHRVEVAVAPERAFEWENLYLCCGPCQGKLPESSIPCGDCLDPCDPAVDPADHLSFQDEIIKPRDGSSRGRETIKKHKLDRVALEHRRGRRLRYFQRVLIRIQHRMIAAGRQSMTDEEKLLLRQFQQPDEPFSAMFRDYRMDEL